MKRELTEDILGDFGFRIRWRYESHWADVEVWEITGRSGGGENTALFDRKGAMSTPDSVESIEDAELYLSGYIKWDGCAELDQGRQHWCGVHSFKKHADLLQWLWLRSGQLLEGREIMEFPDWKDASF